MPRGRDIVVHELTWITIMNACRTSRMNAVQSATGQLLLVAGLTIVPSNTNARGNDCAVIDVRLQPEAAGAAGYIYQ